jgi:putative flippase GtrA/SAM-dependent methyltransferase
VALLSAAGDWLVFVLLASVIGLSPLASLMAARVAGGALSFVSNRNWTWGANRQIALTQQGRRFLLLYAFSYALSVALFRLLTELLSVPSYPSKLATDLSCFVVNYLVMNSYVFHARAGLARFFAARPADPKAFWNGKILDWEASRYGGRAGAANLVEGLAGRASSSVRFRLDAAAQLLTPHLAGRRVVELGCGSGLLAEPLLAAGAVAYQGYDFSEAAITAARKRAATSPRGAAMRFDVAAVAEIPPQGDAVVISLGLVDWLGAAELDHLFALGGGGSCLHAVSEQRRSAVQLIHRAYVQCSYGWKNGGYVPRYHRLAEIAAIAGRHGIGRLNVFRHRRLRFGIFVSDLSLE